MKFAQLVLQLYLKETLAQALFCEFSRNLEEHLFYRTPLVAASEANPKKAKYYDIFFTTNLK